MGGSRVESRVRLVFNLAVVWILTGVWHGAAWNFMLWGVWFFVLLTIEKLCFAKQLKAADSLPFYKKIPAWLYTMIAVLFGWVLFRAENLPLVISYLGAMFGGGIKGDSTALLFVTQRAVFYLSAILFSAPIIPYLRKTLDACREHPRRAAIAVICDAAYPILIAVLFLVCSAYLLKSNYNPFIYFNF